MPSPMRLAGCLALLRLRRQARFAARMVRGVAPSSLPIDQPTRFEFVVNGRAARALGVTIPAVVLLRADEVMQ
jgi:putative ABC transport system substrate-binding protein